MAQMIGGPPRPALHPSGLARSSEAVRWGAYLLVLVAYQLNL